MSLRVPVTASDIADWVRKAAQAINALLAGQEALEARATTLEAGVATNTAGIASLGTRVSTLETAGRPAHPFQELAAAPGTPTEGQTYYDTVLHKVRSYDGATWQAHW